VWDEKSQHYLVKKQFQTKNKYEKERDFYIKYQNELIYVPYIAQWNDAEKIIWTEYCGISLNLKYLPKDRYKFKSRIRSICNDLMRRGLYHNDIRWKNIVENDEGQLFLIDFEVISHDNRERDPEYILRDRPIKNENCTNCSRTTEARL
jgi:tRNA A-37 threonylcarbamoyl transferase component Bud32